MWRRVLIALNYIGVLFLFAEAFLGALITRGNGFELHFYVSMLSLPFAVPSHVGSGIFLTTHPLNNSRTRVPLILLNYVAAGFVLWVTYAGFMIRQGVPFDYHFTLSIITFFIAAPTHVLSALFLAIKYRQPQTLPLSEASLVQE